MGISHESCLFVIKKCFGDCAQAQKAASFYAFLLKSFILLSVIQMHFQEFLLSRLLDMAIVKSD